MTGCLYKFTKCFELSSKGNNDGIVADFLDVIWLGMGWKNSNFDVQNYGSRQNPWTY